VVFALTIVWLIEGWLSESWIKDCGSLLLPIAALAILSFLQTLSLGNFSRRPGAITLETWNTISLDPYQTRFFGLQLLALMLAGVLLFRCASTESRLRTLINVVIGVAVASAIFGILRQTTQHKLGFGLPLLPQDGGYGQFINRNHFAFLMEMGFGLTLGIVLAGGSKREHGLIYLAALLPVWTALVLSGSRGGLIAMLAQVLVTVLLFSVAVRKDNAGKSASKALRLVRSWPMRVVLLVVLLGGVAFGTLWLGGDPLATRIEESRTAFSTESRLGVSRNEIWQLTWRMFMAHPMLGIGMGAYWAAVPAFHDASGTLVPQEAHNDYLELLASGGVVGSAIGVWFAVIVFRRSRQNLLSANRFRRAACFGATIGIIGVAVHSLVDFGLHMILNALVFTTLVTIATSKPTMGKPEDL